MTWKLLFGSKASFQEKHFTSSAFPVRHKGSKARHKASEYRAFLENTHNSRGSSCCVPAELWDIILASTNERAENERASERALEYTENVFIVEAC